MTTAAVEQYTGEGEPPYCEMTLKATNSDEIGNDLLTVPVILSGVRESCNTVDIRRVPVDHNGIPRITLTPPNKCPG